MADIEVRRNEAAGRFEVELEGDVAFAEYRRLGSGDILFPHTIVPEAFEGRGVGSALVEAGLTWARERRAKVIPACSFFARYIERHPEHQDLVSTAARR
jgi:hypothetical protein